MSYLLRVVLPDRPGMLGAVATALGEAGCDILSLDVVERGPAGAVDDLLVELPPGGLADRLITSAQSVPGVIVESLRPYRGAADLHRDLDLVDQLAAHPEQGLQLFADHVPGIFRAGWAVVAEVTDGRPVVLVTSSGAPDVTDLLLPWAPLATGRRLDATEAWAPESWDRLGVELAAVPCGSPSTVALVGRPGGPSFRPSEVLRLAHLAGITATVQAGAAHAGTFHAAG